MHSITTLLTSLIAINAFVFTPDAAKSNSIIIEYKVAEGKKLFDYISDGYQIKSVFQSEMNNNNSGNLREARITTTYYLQKDNKAARCQDSISFVAKEQIQSFICADLVLPYEIKIGK